MSNFSMDSIQQIRESLEAVYINDETGKSIVNQYGFTTAQIKLLMK